MATYEEVAKAVIERWQPVLLNWDTFWWPKTHHPVPALRLAPDPTKHVGLQEVPPMWYLRAELTVDATDEEAGYHLLSELTGTHGPLRSRLLDKNPDHDNLWNLCGLCVAMPDGKNWKPVNRRARLSCAIGLELGAS